MKTLSPFVLLALTLLSCRKSNIKPTVVVNETCVRIVDYTTHKPIEDASIEVSENYNANTWIFNGKSDLNGYWCHHPLSNTFQYISITKEGYNREKMNAITSDIIYLSGPAFLKFKIKNNPPSSPQDKLLVNFRDNTGAQKQLSFNGITDTSFIEKADFHMTSVEWNVNNTVTTSNVSLASSDTTLVEINY